MSSSSSSRTAGRRETCDQDKQRRVRVVVTVLFDHKFASPDYDQLLLGALTFFGASRCRVRGRLALAEFLLVARSVHEASVHVQTRMSLFGEAAEFLVAAGVPGDDGPGLVRFSSDWPEEQPDLNTLHAPDTLSQRSEANEWRSV